MSPILVLALAISTLSFYGAAFLLRLWHEDKASGTNGWPLSRVLAYVGIASTLASNYLAGLTYIRLANVPNYREIQIGLTGLTFVMIIVLLLVIPALALYLRTVRATGYMTASERSGLATEASVQEAIAVARVAAEKAEAAYDVANHSNEKLATLTEALGHKEDKPADAA